MLECTSGVSLSPCNRASRLAAVAFPRLTRSASAPCFFSSARCAVLLAVLSLPLHFLTLEIAAAQPDRPYFRHLTPDDGLAHGIVWSVAKDHKGFMWFGTENGLNRYDGRRFRVFRHTPGDSTSLSGITARALCVDRTGVLWVGTFAGLNRYNPSEENFTRYPLPPGGALEIGRSPSCDIRFPTVTSISRRHARLTFDAGVWLEDLASTNGTRVNDVRVTEPLKLTSGDRIQAEG